MLFRLHLFHLCCFNAHIRGRLAEWIGVQISELAGLTAGPLAPLPSDFIVKTSNRQPVDRN